MRLVSVTTGGASIGPDRSLRVGILKNDSPNGVFSFLAIRVSSTVDHLKYFVNI